MNVIKTAIVTIIISIISGLLVEHFKNLAPRILCSIGNGVPTEKNNRKVYAYVITISNLSKKIIHELTLNIQSSRSNLEIADAKITKGLRFDSSVKGNILDIDIPFLSKGDKFSVTVYIEKRTKPVIVMRSPENFKRIDSEEQNGILSALFNTQKSTNGGTSDSAKRNKAAVPSKNDDFTMVMNKAPSSKKSIGKEIMNISNRKKAIIAVTSIVLLIIAAGLVKFCFKSTPNSAQASTTKTDVSKQSTDLKKSGDGSTRGGSESSSGQTKNTNARPYSQKPNKNGGVNSSSNDENKNGGAKTPTTGSQNVDTKGTSGGANENKDEKSPTNTTPSNTDTKDSGNGTNSNTNTNNSTGGTNQNTNTNQSTNTASGNTGK